MRFLLLCCLCACAALACAQPAPPLSPPDPYDSGGVLHPAQAAYDVTFYDLTLRVDPADSSIAGALTAHARIVHPTAWFVLDLDPLLAVEGVAWRGEALAFERRGGQLWSAFPSTRQPGDTVAVTVRYGGRPRIAPTPPWDGGFVWSRTPSGAPWIATACQQQGADVWWPVKDHVSDEPDSMALHIRVPRPLVVATNGALRTVEDHADTTRTYHWHVSTPINTYAVALNIAPYVMLTDEMKSSAGGTFPIQFFVLPEDSARGQALLPEIKDHLRFYETALGPYPFRADKYGVAQTPHLGMEHQSIIAYGAGFDNGAMTGGVDWGFDALHHHELAHEWWGNLVTNVSWEDMWIHEGFGSYMQPLYLERTQGPERARAYRATMRQGITNNGPLAPHETHSARQIYGGDVYVKGAWVLHTLRYVLGEETFFRFLRRMAYPDAALEAVTDGRQTRFATTADAQRLAEDLSGQDLGWFFSVYLRQPTLPRLVVTRDGGEATLRWETPLERPFPMPLEVDIDGTRTRLSMTEGHATITLSPEATLVLDPDAWILHE